MKSTRATQAREKRKQIIADSGLTVKQIAKRVGICQKYLQQKIAGGDTPYHLACDLSNLLNCRMEIFL